MELRHLRYFIAVAEELHFSRAAERIGIEQSPLSRAIRELEKDLGVRLLSRTSRCTRITGAGKVFLSEARRILLAVKTARGAAQAVGTGQTGQITIGISQSVSQPRLARLLHMCRTEDPGIEFCILDRSLRAQKRGLRDGLLDIGLAPCPMDGDGLRSEPLWAAPLAAVLPASHELSGVRLLPPSALLRRADVVCHRDLRQALASIPEMRGLVGDSKQRARCASIASLPVLLEMVASGLAVGVTLAPQVDSTRRLDVVVRTFESTAASATTYAVLPAAETPEKVARVLSRARTLV
jgi:DNA-binding transcriptional LysR family regulator